MGLSFPTISASGPNGSVIHYHPEESTKRQITTQEIYLCDSGAQYMYENQQIVVDTFPKVVKFFSGMVQLMLPEHGTLANRLLSKLIAILVY